MEKMELSEALKANASVLEGLIGTATVNKDGLASIDMAKSTPVHIAGIGKRRYINFAKLSYGGAESFIISISRQDGGTGNVALCTLRCNYFQDDVTLSKLVLAGNFPEMYYKITDNNVYLMVDVYSWYHLDFCSFGTGIIPISEEISSNEGYFKFT